MAQAEKMPAQPIAQLQQNTSSDDLTPLQVGEHEPTKQAIRYLDENSWQQIVHYPEATYIKIHFAQFDLMPGDVVVVTGNAGNQRHVYPSSAFTTDEGKGFWSLSILGDTAVVELRRGALPQPSATEPAYQKALAGASMSELGVEIDKFARGYPTFDVNGDNFSTCGNLDRTDVACYETSHPTEFATADAVVRILNNGASHCTGWRVSPNNFLFTNEHCITSQTELNQMEFWFNYQRPSCGSGDPNGNVTMVTGDQFLIDDTTLDFALITLNDFATIQSFGYLELDPRTPILGEEIYIPQHGAGNPKEFGIESDVNLPDNLCQIDLAIADGIGTGTDTGYFCDTIGGSSGSPVIARSTNRVIALHHFGNGAAPNCTAQSDSINRGVLIEQIWPLVEPFFPSLSLEKTANPDPVTSGEIMTYTLTATNSTTTTLNMVTISDTVPISTTYVPSSASDGGSESGGVVSYPPVTLPAGASISRTFQVQVDSGLGATLIFSDDTESGAGNWTVSNGGGADDWSLGAANPNSGSSAWFAADVASVTDQYLALTSPFTPTSGSEFRFWHHYNTEATYDGGVVEVSVANGPWTDLSAQLTQNGYNSIISDAFGSPIGGREAFSGDSGGYLQTAVDLTSFVGQPIQIRFRMATDSSVSADGWYVDDVEVVANAASISNTACVSTAEGETACGSVETMVLASTCAVPASPTNITITENGNDVDLAWDAVGDADHYEVWVGVNEPYFDPGLSCDASPDCSVAATNSHTFSTGIGDSGNNYYFVVLSVNACGSQSQTIMNRVAEFDYPIVPGQ